jgi:hypothetical protein
MDSILSPDELAARYKNLTTATLTDWRYKGKGPAFFRAGKRVFYREADVLAWEAAEAAPEVEKRKSA